MASIARRRGWVGSALAATMGLMAVAALAQPVPKIPPESDLTIPDAKLTPYQKALRNLYFVDSKAYPVRGQCPTDELNAARQDFDLALETAVDESPEVKSKHSDTEAALKQDEKTQADPNATPQQKKAADDVALAVRAEEDKVRDRVKSEILANTETGRRAAEVMRMFLDLNCPTDKAQPPAPKVTPLVLPPPGRSADALLNIDEPEQKAAPPSPKVNPPLSRALTPLESGVLREINQARTDPAHYALGSYGFPAALVGEAKAFLHTAAPLQPLELNDHLNVAAAAHLADEGPKGGESHAGSDGTTPMQRVQATGLWPLTTGEVISIAEAQPGGVMAQLTIDPPGPQHPHREDLFSTTFTSIGIACGPNAKFGTMCVVDMTGALAPTQ